MNLRPSVLETDALPLSYTPAGLTAVIYSIILEVATKTLKKYGKNTPPGRVYCLGIVKVFPFSCFCCSRKCRGTLTSTKIQYGAGDFLLCTSCIL